MITDSGSVCTAADHIDHTSNTKNFCSWVVYTQLYITWSCVDHLQVWALYPQLYTRVRVCSVVLQVSISPFWDSLKLGRPLYFADREMVIHRPVIH